MSFIKMNDILVKTGHFFVTFSYSAKGKWGDQEIENPVLEVSQIIPKKRSALAKTSFSPADAFFQIITSDSSSHNRNFKKGLIQQFTQSCSKKDFEEFWDTAGWSFLESIAPSIPTITCVLYNIRGEAARVCQCNPVDIIHGLKKIEEALFVHSLAGKQKNTFAPVAFPHKEMKKDNNRKIHKYSLHHHHG